MIRLPESAPLYSEISVRFRLGDEANPFEFNAEVRSCMLRHGAYDIGLRFLPAEDDRALQLEKVLEKEFERREARRYAMRARVAAKREHRWPTAGGQPKAAPEAFELFGRDVSLRGMRLLSTLQLMPGDRLEVNLKFRLGHQMMQAGGIVRWCHEDDKRKRYEIGLEFTDLDPQSSDFLISLVDYMRR